MSQQSFSSFNEFVSQIECSGIKVIKGRLKLETTLTLLKNPHCYLSFPYCIGEYNRTSKALGHAYTDASVFISRLEARGVSKDTTYIYVDTGEDGQDSFRLMAEFQHACPDNSKDIKDLLQEMMTSLLHEMGHELANNNRIRNWHIHNYRFLQKGLHELAGIDYPPAEKQLDAVRKLAEKEYGSCKPAEAPVHASHVSDTEEAFRYEALEAYANDYTGDRIVDRMGTDRLLTLLPIADSDLQPLKKFLKTYNVDYRIKFKDNCYFPQISIDSYIRLRLGTEEYGKINSEHGFYEYIRKNRPAMNHPVIISFSPEMIADTCQLEYVDAYNLVVLLTGARPAVAGGKPIQTYIPVVGQENSLSLDAALDDLKNLCSKRKQDRELALFSSSEQQREVIDGLACMSPLNSLPQCFFEDEKVTGTRSGLDRLITFEPIDARNIELIKKILRPDETSQGKPKVLFREIAPGILCPVMQLRDYLSQRFGIQPERMSISEVRSFLNRKTVREAVETPYFGILDKFVGSKISDSITQKRLKTVLRCFSGSFCADERMDDIRRAISNLNRQVVDTILIDDFGRNYFEDIPIGL